MAVAGETTATLYFLHPNPEFETVKPYTIQYEPHGDIPQTNTKRKEESDIPMHDLRSISSTLSFNKDGMLVRRLEGSKMNYVDFTKPEVVKSVYLEEVKRLLQTALGTQNVAVLEYLIRRRHKSFPLAADEHFKHAQPVANVHVDFSPDYIYQILLDRFGEARTKELSKLHYGIVNVWKPLIGPVQDWPLALCHPGSIDADSHLELTDTVYPMTVEESIQVYYDRAQKWYYLSEQQVDEVLIFRGGDSELGMKGGVPHCSFEHPHCPTDVPPRESIEVRALVFYSDNLLALERQAGSHLHGPRTAEQAWPT